MTLSLKVSVSKLNKVTETVTLPRTSVNLNFKVTQEIQILEIILKFKKNCTTKFKKKQIRYEGTPVLQNVNGKIIMNTEQMPKLSPVRAKAQSIDVKCDDILLKFVKFHHFFGIFSATFLNLALNQQKK